MERELSTSSLVPPWTMSLLDTASMLGEYIPHIRYRIQEAEERGR